MSLEQLQTKLGPLDAKTLRRLCSSGVIEPAGDDDGYLVRDRRVVNDFAALMSRGMPLADILTTSAAVDKKLDEAARALARHGHTEIVRQRGSGWYPTNDAELAWAADVIDVMRRVARRSAHASLDRALDEAVRAEMREYRRAADQTGASDRTTAAR